MITNISMPVQNVYLEIRGQSTFQLLKCLELLQKNNIDYTILESYPTDMASIEKPIGKKPIEDKQLGRSGRQILELLAKGYTYNEIAKELEMSVNGVRYYIKKVFKHLNVTNGRDAVRIYLLEMAT